MKQKCKILRNSLELFIYRDSNLKDALVCFTVSITEFIITQNTVIQLIQLSYTEFIIGKDDQCPQL